MPSQKFTAREVAAVLDDLLLRLHLERRANGGQPISEERKLATVEGALGVTKRRPGRKRFQDHHRLASDVASLRRSGVSSITDALEQLAGTEHYQRHTAEQLQRHYDKAVSLGSWSPPPGADPIVTLYKRPDHRRRGGHGFVPESND
jgi:hypothetical protein